MNATFTASYELFSVRKFSDLSRTRADLEGAQASELQQRFRTALLTESDYYAVLQNQELARVAGDRTRRAEEGLAIARARVVSGAAVQSDSLQLVLELTQARTDQLRRDAALTVSRLQLGRRIGEAGPVDAQPRRLRPRRRSFRSAWTRRSGWRSTQGPQYRGGPGQRARGRRPSSRASAANTCRGSP